LGVGKVGFAKAVAALKDENVFEIGVVKYGDEKPAKYIIALHVRNVDAELLPFLLNFVSANQESDCKIAS